MLQLLCEHSTFNVFGERRRPFWLCLRLVCGVQSGCPADMGRKAEDTLRIACFAPTRVCASTRVRGGHSALVLPGRGYLNTSALIVGLGFVERLGFSPLWRLWARLGLGGARYGQWPGTLCAAITQQLTYTHSTGLQKWHRLSAPTRNCKYWCSEFRRATHSLPK